VTHRGRETPQRALLAGAALGFVVALAIHLAPQGSPVGAVLLNMAVFGAVIAYMLQMVSFIVLRVRFPKMERPFRSPAGVAGAAVALAVAGVTLVTLFQNPAYNKGVIGAALWFLLGIAYYVLYARRRLVLAPEEAAALAHRREEGLR
jgi:ethanolamine permease